MKSIRRETILCCVESLSIYNGITGSGGCHLTVQRINIGVYEVNQIVYGPNPYPLLKFSEKISFFEFFMFDLVRFFCVGTRDVLGMLDYKLVSKVRSTVQPYP